MKLKIHHITPEQYSFIYIRILKIESYLITLSDLKIVYCENEKACIKDILEMLYEVSLQ